VVTTASLLDRDGAFRITAALREALSTITLVRADAGYAGRFVRDARKIWDLAVAIVKRPDQAKGFVLLHRRWVVERSFAWLTKFRRLVRGVGCFGECRPYGSCCVCFRLMLDRKFTGKAMEVATRRREQ